MNTAGDLKKLKKQFNIANDRNQQRLTGIMGLLDGTDAQAIDDTRRAGAEERGDITGQLITQGLGNTTRLQALMQRQREGENRNVNALRQATAVTKAGVLERVSDEGPDIAGIGDMVAKQAAGEAGSKRSHTTIGGAPGGINDFLAGGAGAGGGGGGSGGGGKGGGSRTQGNREGGGGSVNTYGGSGKGIGQQKGKGACGYIKTHGCTLPDGSTWPNSKTVGLSGGTSSTGKSRVTKSKSGKSTKKA